MDKVSTKKVAILTRDFINLCGAFDFIKNIILALDYVAKDNDLELFILVPKKKRRGLLNKLKYKLKGKYLKNIDFVDNHPDFIEYKNCKVVEYYEPQLPFVIESLKIDAVLPDCRMNCSFKGVEQIGYLYDCQHKYYPEFFDQKECVKRDEHFTRLLNTQKKIIVNAESVKSDLIKFYSATPSQIKVLPFTPKIKEDYLDDNVSLIKQYQLPEKYFMNSNQFWLHKDHTTLFTAFAKIKDSSVHLVCTGTMEEYRKPEYIAQLKTLICDLGIENRVHLLGLIPKRDQIEIMKNSLAVIQTTLFEGGPGGGSVWDAISLGVPVIVSDISTNLEISEDNVFFFNAKNVDDLHMKIQELLDNISSIIRPTKEELVDRSKKNISKLGNYITSILKEEKKIPDLKISVITVCRNVEKEIENTLLSLYNQTYQNIEHIVIDGDSNDNTLKILEYYRDNISFLVSEPDNGIYNAMNKGLNLVTGDIIYFLNAGDSLFSDTVLETVANAFSNSAAKIVIGDVFFFVRDDNINNEFIHNPNEIHSYERIKKDIDFEGPCHQVIFYRKEVFDKVGKYNEDYKIYADYEFNLRAFVFNRMPLLYLNETFAKFELGGISTKRSISQSEEFELIRKNTGYDKLINRDTPFKKFMNRYFRSILKICEKLLGQCRQNLLNFVE